MTHLIRNDTYKPHEVCSFDQESLTIVSVIPRHIPDPPPVQKRTFPLKIPDLKIDVDSTIGTTWGEGDMTCELVQCSL